MLWVLTVATLEVKNNKKYLHKNKIYSPKENNFIGLYLQYGRCENLL